MTHTYPHTTGEKVERRQRFGWIDEIPDHCVDGEAIRGERATRLPSTAPRSCSKRC